MANDDPALGELRVLSIVEALTVTGPVKPLLMFSSLAQRGLNGCPRVVHALMTTRRTLDTMCLNDDKLYTATIAAGLQFLPVRERHRYDPAVLREMRGAIRSWRPDIVETHDCKSHALFLALRTLYGDMRRARWIAFHHGYTRTSLRVRLYQWLDYLTLRRADRVVTLCKPFAEMLVRRGVPRRKLSVISNAIAMKPAPSNDTVLRCRSELGLSPGQLLLLCVGRLSDEKGQLDLITAFRSVFENARGFSARLVLAGDGPDRSRLAAAALSLGESVVFAGHVPDPWVLFHAADIFILPSRSEGSPLVMFEAMAAGAAIIATRVGGVPEVLESGRDALLVPAQDPDAMTSAIARLAQNPELRRQLTQTASSTLDTYSPEAYGRRLLAIYDMALDRRAA